LAGDLKDQTDRTNFLLTMQNEGTGQKKNKNVSQKLNKMNGLIES
jgi:hypothetical protein